MAWAGCEQAAGWCVGGGGCYVIAEPVGVGGGFAAGGTGRASRVVDRAIASLMFAGWDRTVCMRRSSPTLCSRPGLPESKERSGIGSASAGGWRVAGGPTVVGIDRRDGRTDVVMSDGELGPHEPGELAGDRGVDGGLGLFAGGEVPEAST